MRTASLRRWKQSTQNPKTINMETQKKLYVKAKAGRLHAEEILKALERTREKLEESMNEIDDRIKDVVNERKDFEAMEEKLLKQFMPQPWHG